MIISTPSESFPINFTASQTLPDQPGDFHALFLGAEITAKEMFADAMQDARSPLRRLYDQLSGLHAELGGVMTSYYHNLRTGYEALAKTEAEAAHELRVKIAQIEAQIADLLDLFQPQLFWAAPALDSAMVNEALARLSAEARQEEAESAEYAGPRPDDHSVF